MVAHAGRTSKGPSLTGRALLALTFLFGFYVLAVVLVGLLVALNVVRYGVSGRLSLPLVALTLFVASAVVKGVFFGARMSSADVAGIAVDEGSQPELVRLVREVAALVGTAPPDRIFLVSEVNASVMETGGLLGLGRGERVMSVGVPLIDALTVDQLRAVIAHELGLYANGDTRLGGLTYRAGASVDRTVRHLGDAPLASLFRAYGARYMRLSLKVRRRQTLSADTAAARLAGREVWISTLRRVETSCSAFDLFLQSYLFPLWQRGYDADNALEGFRALLDDADRQEELSKLEAGRHDDRTNCDDTHPSLADRVAHAQRCPEGPSTGSDTQLALTLLAQPDQVERQMSRMLTREVTGHEIQRALSWNRGAAEVYGDSVCADGDVLLRIAGQVAGQPGPASLADAIELVEDGRGDELAAALSDDLDDVAPEQRADVRAYRLQHHLTCAMSAYLVAERGHRWAISWSGPLGVVDGKGNWKDVEALTAELIEDPGSASRLRRSLGGAARLSTFRIAFEEDEDSSQALPDMVHVQPDVQIGRKPFDAVLFTTGLVLHPIDDGVGDAVRRLLSSHGVGGPAGTVAQRRLETLFDEPARIVLGSAPGAIAIDFDEILSLRPQRGRDIEIHVTSDPRPRRVRCPSTKNRDALLKSMNELLLAQVSAVLPSPAAA